MIAPLFLRTDANDTVILASQSLADYLGIDKSSLLGSSLESVAEMATGELRECFRRADSGRRLDQLVVDGFSRVFEAKTWSEGGVFDVLLDEVTSIQPVLEALRDSSSIPIDDLSEEEMATIRRPDRRTVSVLSARLVNFSEFIVAATPIETRLVVGSFTDEVTAAIPEFGGVPFARGEEFCGGIFGAPRSFADHALRALNAGLGLSAAMESLRKASHMAGREFPLVACGIATGECLVGTFGASGANRYSALGSGPDIAHQLANLAMPGEILITESCLRQILERLPEGWTVEELVVKEPPDLSSLRWSGEEVQPLPEDRQMRALGLRDAASGPPVLEFHYIWSLRPTAAQDAIPVLRVEILSASGTELPVGDAREESSFLQIFGKYRLVNLVGSGGMGKVWKARDRFGNTVALKTLHENGGLKPEQIRRFQREAEIMSRLPHRNICRIYEAGEFERIQYLTMEFVDGLSLADLLSGLSGEGKKRKADATDLQTLIRKVRSGIASAKSREDSWQSRSEDSPQPAHERLLLPIEQALSIFIKVCDAVQFAHEHGVLHRDLKPGNILLREDGEPLVADFGLAKFTGSREDHSISVSGHVLGTLANMAPEQAESSKDVDERADIYSLGTILYVLMTGKSHFRTSGNFFADVERLRKYTPPSARSTNSRVDLDLDIIIAKCLRPNPADRYRSASSLLSDLALYRRGEPVAARRISPVEHGLRWTKRHRVAAAAALAGLLLVVGGTALGFLAVTQRAREAEAARTQLEKTLAERDEATLKSKLVTEERNRAEKRVAAAEKETANERTLREKVETDLQTLDALYKESANRIAESEKLQVAAEAKSADLATSLAASDTLIEQATARIAELEKIPAGSPPAGEPTPAIDAPGIADTSAAEVYSDLATTLLRVKLDRSELPRFQQKPMAVLDLISEGIELASQAIERDRTYAPAWMVKGRLHLACLEIAAAGRAFEMAAQSPEIRREEAKPALPSAEDPSALIGITAKLNKPYGDLMGTAASLLAGTRSPENKTVANILLFMIGKSGINPAVKSGNSTNSRVKSAVERLIDFVSDNGNRGKVNILAHAPDGSPESLAISGIQEISDMSSLRPIKLKALKILGAGAISWKDLAAFPLSSLVLENCPLPYVPADIPAFKDLRSLALRDAPITSLAFVSHMQGLEKLDIADTKISDISPIDTCRNLHALDASGLAIAKIGKSFPSQLTDLTITPSLVSPDALKTVRGIRTIAVLRKPDDPKDQCARVFWDNWDATTEPAEHKP